MFRGFTVLTERVTLLPCCEVRSIVIIGALIDKLVVGGGTISLAIRSPLPYVNVPVILTDKVAFFS